MVRVTIEEAYEILGVGKLSNIEEVKSAYRRLALQTHPDRNKDDPVAHQKFLKVSEAFRRIIDPDVLEICVQVEDEELEGEAGDSEDGDYDYVESDEYEEEDYEAMFAFRMFEKMFAYGGGGGGVDGAPMGSTSGGKEKRSVCTCWECRNSRSFFLPKPPSKYIPKSQRPKDPELESKKAAPPSDPHENWLSDDDVAGAGGAGKKKAKKAGTSKKKNKKEKEKGKAETKSQESKEPSNASTVKAAEGNKAAQSKASKGKAAVKGSEAKQAEKKDSSSSESSSESSHESDDEKEDFISAEEMAKRLNIKTVATKVVPKTTPRVAITSATTNSTSNSSNGSSIPPAGVVNGSVSSLDANGFIPAKPMKDVKPVASVSAPSSTASPAAPSFKVAPTVSKAPAWVVQAQNKAAAVAAASQPAQAASTPQVERIVNAMHVEDKRIKVPAAAPPHKAAVNKVSNSTAIPAPMVKKDVSAPPRSNVVPTDPPVPPVLKSNGTNGSDLLDIPPLLSLPQGIPADDEDMPPLHPIGDFGMSHQRKARNAPPPGLDGMAHPRVTRLDSEPPGLSHMAFGGGAWNTLNPPLFGVSPQVGVVHESLGYDALLGSSNLELDRPGMPTLMSSLRAGSPELNSLNVPLGQLESNFRPLEPSLLQSLERNTSRVDDQYSFMMGGFLNSLDLSLDSLNSTSNEGLFSSNFLQDQFTPSSITALDALLDAHENAPESVQASAAPAVAKMQSSPTTVFTYASAVGASVSSATAVPSAESKLSNEEVRPPSPADASPPAMITIGPSTSSYQRAYKVKKCVYFFSPRGCIRGEHCTFLHEDPESSGSSSQISNKVAPGFGKR